MIAGTSFAIRCLAIAGYLLAAFGDVAFAQQSTRTLASYDFVPTVPFAAKYKHSNPQRPPVPGFAFDYQFGNAKGKCQATFATAELSIKDGRYELELNYNFTCPFKTGLSTTYVSRDQGRIVEAPDGLYFLHDLSTDRAEGRNLLGTASSSFDHDMRYVAVGDVQEEKGKGRQLQGLLVQVNAYRGKGNGSAAPLFWMFPSDMKYPVKTVGEPRQRDQSGERYWMPRLRSAVGVEAERRPPPRDTTNCAGRFVLPDSMWMISGENPSAPISVWAQTGWKQVSAPTAADTIGMATTGLLCSTGSTVEFLLERYGFFIKVDTTALSKVVSDGSITVSHVRVRGASGLAHAMMQQTCSGDVCTVSLSAAEPVAMKLKVEIADRNAKAEAAAQAKRAQASAAEERRAKAAEAARYASNIARFKRAGASPKEVEAALAGRVTVGMSQNLVTEILGQPSKIDRRPTELGTYIAWHYSGLLLEMANGRVKAIK
jgi:hypothetical protein